MTNVYPKQVSFSECFKSSIVSDQLLPKIIIFRNHFCRDWEASLFSDTVEL